MSVLQSLTTGWVLFLAALALFHEGIHWAAWICLLAAASVWGGFTVYDLANKRNS